MNMLLCRLSRKMQVFWSFLLHSHFSWEADFGLITNFPSYFFNKVVHDASLTFLAFSYCLQNSGGVRNRTSN